MRELAEPVVHEKVLRHLCTKGLAFSM
jgi:hypothetical protein